MTNVNKSVRIYNIGCEFMVLPSCAMLCISWVDKADSDTSSARHCTSTPCKGCARTCSVLDTQAKLGVLRFIPSVGLCVGNRTRHRARLWLWFDKILGPIDPCRKGITIVGMIWRNAGWPPSCCRRLKSLSFRQHSLSVSAPLEYEKCCAFEHYVPIIFLRLIERIWTKDFVWSSAMPLFLCCALW